MKKKKSVKKKVVKKATAKQKVSKKKNVKKPVKKKAVKKATAKKNSELKLKKDVNEDEMPQPPMAEEDTKEITIKRGKFKEGFIKTAVPGLDELFEKGIPKEKTVLLEGSPGTGKTILCLQMAYNFCLQGKKVLYMSFEESEESLRSHMTDFGWNPQGMETKGLFKIKRFSSIDVARSVEALLSEAKRELLISAEPIIFPKDFDPEIVLIDSLSSIASAFSGEDFRFRVFMEQLFRFLEEKKVSTFLIKETSYPTHIGSAYADHDDTGGAISFLADGIICLYNVVYSSGIRSNAIEILKIRGANFKKLLVKFEITKKGIIIYPNQKLSKGYKLS
ncbi:MAG: AAA family ATPase [Nanoarchaeota archaeon]|nr:AAA family ATPase [Nanoarchaeota archaeon]MBU4456428.1 AAA family ATPase [Nanoarchaeota archaeon]MCG2719110.1 AAA family ATPase [Nanoarchaeota archaeon]